MILGGKTILHFPLDISPIGSPVDLGTTFQPQGEVHLNMESTQRGFLAPIVPIHLPCLSHQTKG